MMSAEDRKRIEESLKANLEYTDKINRDRLKLLERQYQLFSDWTTNISTLSFAVGAAVVPLVNQFSVANHVKHPLLLLLAAVILIINGTVIQLVKKVKLEDEADTIRSFGLPVQISIQKTMNAEASFLHERLSKTGLAKRYSTQLREADGISQSHDTDKREHISMELDIYLGAMLIGFGLIGGSIIDSLNNFRLYLQLSSLALVAYLIYVLWSYRRSRKGLLDNQAKERELRKLREEYGSVYRD